VTATADATTTLDAARALAPTITSRAVEIEEARRLPPDLVEMLAARDCFGVLLPRSHGGLGAELPLALQTYEALSRADASVGWTVMIGSAAWCDLVGLPRDTFDALFAAGEHVIVGGVFNPTGTATADRGGYRVDGRWSFASGCEHCTWLYGNCVEEHEGDHRLRIAVFSPDEIGIEDTWHVSGLRGTGSHHFHAHDVHVAADRTCLVFTDEPCIDAPVVRVGVPALIALAIASVAIGIAQGALDDILSLATEKVPLLAAAPLAANPHFQCSFANSDAALRAARALLYETADETWQTAVEGSRVMPPQRARLRAAAVWATARAAAVVDAAYQAGGGTALYADSPLQRRLRDVHAVTQHFLVKPDTLTTAGAVLCGQPADLTVF
jgi:alkylation response protein AidB-like acyl-CoA dehydrogenase